ncbi:MAG: metallophosphatase family protein [Nitrospinae bacterium CG11_big_fil_rev_8_21_14_0_20_56_8]|nr:MAG: metallophosphatase family protein [Nitrospinae bacterium CG11_big_fil_rev_8_21_14_0_20_56_8]
MKYLVFSDVHANLEAVQAFCAVIRNIDHDKKVCLGDMVGYCADPNPVVDWLRKEVDLGIAGNHDLAVLGSIPTYDFNPYAVQSCVWTRKVLSPENKEYLNSLPLIREEDDICWVHASPFEPKEWHYVLSKHDGKQNFDAFNASVCFLGHSHRPLVLEQNSNSRINGYVFPRKVQLEPDHRYIFNVGSLGQPRDGVAQPSFVVYDSGARTVEFYRFGYDYSPTQEKILTQSLPPFFAERLAYGM